PYVFQYDEEDATYVAGPLLQGKKWFDYYLEPRGMTFVEGVFDKGDVCRFLDETKMKCMIGLHLGTKHAVIYEGKEKGKYKFLNNKRELEEASDYYFFTKDELVEVLSEQNTIGYIERLESPKVIDAKQEIFSSIQYIEKYQQELYTFCHKEQTTQALIDTRDKLFAAALLHIVSMMEMVGQKALAEELCEIRSQYMSALKQSRTLKLSEHMEYERLEKAIEGYKKIIMQRLDGESLKEE
ncbi:MAG: hypothetical protein ACRCWY_12385, partial [Cellulosilyticaceae bacterium]